MPTAKLAKADWEREININTDTLPDAKEGQELVVTIRGRLSGFSSHDYGDGRSRSFTVVPSSIEVEVPTMGDDGRQGSHSPLVPTLIPGSMESGDGPSI